MSTHFQHYQGQCREAGRALIHDLGTIARLQQARLFFVHEFLDGFKPDHRYSNRLYVYVDNVERVPEATLESEDRFHTHMADLLITNFPNKYNIPRGFGNVFQNRFTETRICFVNEHSHPCRMSTPVPLSFLLNPKHDCLPFASTKEKLVFAVTTYFDRETFGEREACAKAADYYAKKVRHEGHGRFRLSPWHKEALQTAVLAFDDYSDLELTSWLRALGVDD
ncbi:uncharacterized protein BDV14DRAFT_204984 [Aspergillus stella-maris]|uniref:uncharacterized protein n=1 Tax=Aspergillus stella-maris TaxID=1810926 RepID=UPI003CCCDEC8